LQHLLINFKKKRGKKKKMYTAADFARIQRTGVQYNLPEETIVVLRRLADLVGAEMPLQKSKSNRVEKHGNEKTLAEIKSDLNKLSDDTFREIAPSLLQNIKLLSPEIGANIVMDTAANNAFYAHLYAKILVQCADHVKFATERAVAHEARVLAGDVTCRAFTSFLVRLVHEKGLPDTVVAVMAANFQDAIEWGMHDIAARGLNEELVEHVIELVEWLPSTKLAAMATRLPKNNAGITFKVMFKYLEYQEKTLKKKILLNR
jgi:hypothetical protein